jgi:phosphoribosylformimino-5-aminoimidazole carboxamide ribotide isomerase
MIVYPAIDLLDGACVRLHQGDFEAVTRFSDEPLQVARAFASAGARALHVVDLDGARSGWPVHAELIGEIAAVTGLPVQVGGGIRTAGQAAAYLDAGVHRVLVGTAAISDADWLFAAVRDYGTDRVAAAVDVRDGEVMIEGWLAGSGIDVDAIGAGLKARGISTVLYTDTRRDGTLSSADVEGTRRLAESGFEVIAAGGVTTADDIRALRAAGAAGVVIGSALYRGRLTLQQALDAAC